MMDSVGIRDRDTRKGAVSPVQNETICGQPHPTVPSTPPHGPLKLPAGPKMRTAGILQQAYPRAPEVQQPLAETQFPLARHSLTVPFHNARSRHLETFQQAIQRPPANTLALAPPVKPLVQRPAGRVIKELQAALIADQPIVVPRPLELGLERAHRSAQLLVTVGFNPFSHPLHSAQPFLSGRASFHPRFALSIRFPVKFESQKIKPPIVRSA